MEKSLFYSSDHGNLELLETAQPETNYFPAAKRGKNPWDKAHELQQKKSGNIYIEPNEILSGKKIISQKNEEVLESLESVAQNDYDPEWPYPQINGKADKKFWYLGDEFSQLKSARDSVSDTTPVIRIAHFDTGYDPEHKSLLKNSIDTKNQKNFVEENNSSIDIGSEGLINNPGHGTGTLSILAGNTMKIDEYQHNDFIGIHKNIKILPLRISRSVMLWKNKAFVDALEHVISLYDTPDRCDIVTMSMGGMPSKAWADVINRAYEKGIFIVTAAGNNIGRATPSTLVYPARFERVTAACGVTYDYSPYYKPFGIRNIKTMEGNYGPKKCMTKAIAAFTPNVAWAIINSGNLVSINGAGTSSATPQIASAAALYYQKYHTELNAMPGWKKIETIRQAMFDSAAKKIKDGFDNDITLYFGNGILQANDMLEIKPSQVTVKKADPAKVSWPFLKLVTGTELLESSIEMYEVEILQLISKSASLQKLLEYEEKNFDELTDKEQRQFYAIILEIPETSEALKQLILDNKLY
ncbi:S8 family peptidase [Flavobacterium panacagri]|uniref:S8 family peptidase n=1 Tax=Flavobacterium panacagri TaxID=3034146 RepID=UPI0025A65A33|nr:S8/S53 family peptidase [Flavobacterium panacagri]